MPPRSEMADDKRQRDLAIVENAVRVALFGRSGSRIRSLADATELVQKSAHGASNEGDDVFDGRRRKSRRCPYCFGSLCYELLFQKAYERKFLTLSERYDFSKQYTAWFITAITRWLLDEVRKLNRRDRTESLEDDDVADAALLRRIGQEDDPVGVEVETIDRARQAEKALALIPECLPRIKSARSRCILKLRLKQTLGPEECEWLAQQRNGGILDAELAVGRMYRGAEPDDPIATEQLLDLLPVRRNTLDVWVKRSREELARELRQELPALSDYFDLKPTSKKSQPAKSRRRRK